MLNLLDAVSDMSTRTVELMSNRIGQYVNLLGLKRDFSC